MARIPLEDNYDDVLKKAQRGLAITDEQLAHRAEVSLNDLVSLKSGKFDEAVARRVARHLKLHPNSLVDLAQKSWYPSQPIFARGFMAFNTPMEDMTVNSYIVWDERSSHAAIFDTGATAEPMLDFVRAEKLNVRYVFLTHTHEDHIADLPRIAAETNAEVWSSVREPVDFPGAKTFEENAFFHLGPFSIKTLSTWGHSPGGTSYYIKGLSYPLAIVGDALFASSMGGAPPEVYKTAWENSAWKLIKLPSDTVLACGHGPVTTVRQERDHNPFFAR